MKKLVVLSGAGMSADSGIDTFRDSGGLWEGHDVMEVASPQGFERNPGLVLDFYNKRRQQLFEVVPNAGHQTLAALEKHFEVHIVTQNVDDLHERAGSTRVMHLHGELLKARSTGPSQKVYRWEKDIYPEDRCQEGFPLRPHIVWFGEAVPLLDNAVDLVMQADILLVVGTSLQVYPAAGLLGYKRFGVPLYLVDPNPSLKQGDMDHLTILAEKAAKGLPILANQLLDILL
ncbi:SIR2 family NAD-dependent protein deacylase [Robiginitalea aurantiaca]|uniref:NAD-dependent protein deacylase n=1 Tax=Robiginitalea aurantiaca TaxID=3056915 RepID=A0ABT7WCB5_9FLAO|nr:NAD-dependent deacylase [Robiginitalea aurantiaca]MDM9630551.1 NAD-dependent deacylase [Robiginitalea aurantiaca]